MHPTIKENDVVLVNRLAYFFSKPKINDIVIIKKKKDIIKRIIKVEDEKIFVVGDNKNKSTDSRKFGWVSKKQIVGKVIFKISNY